MPTLSAVPRQGTRKCLRRTGEVPPRSAVRVPVADVSYPPDPLPRIGRRADAGRSLAVPVGFVTQLTLEDGLVVCDTAAADRRPPHDAAS